MEKHKFYDQSVRAHYNMSHAPKKRAQSECDFYEELKANILGGQGEDKEELLHKLDQKFSAYLTAKSRTASPMITGPARFPVERNNKALLSESKRFEELMAFVASAQKGPKVIVGTDDKLQEQIQRVESLKKNQETMIAINKIIRAGGGYNEIKAAFPTLEEENLKELFSNKNWWGSGFAPFQLTNNRNRLKQAQERLLKLQKISAKGTSERIFGGVRVVENTVEDRIQLFFDGKPDQSIIQKLKALAMKWSPSRGCWQRQLTQNAIYAVNNFLKTFEVQS